MAIASCYNPHGSLWHSGAKQGSIVLLLLLPLHGWCHGEYEATSAPSSPVSNWLPDCLDPARSRRGLRTNTAPSLMCGKIATGCSGS